MIKLITCDIDGTLLHGSEIALNDTVRREIRRLMDKGILFCPASGRQYESLKTLFAPMAGHMACICENGSVVFCPGGELLGKTPLDQDKALALCREIVAQPDLELMAAGENMSYLCPKDESFVDHVEHFVKNTATVLADPAHIPEEIIKVACFCRKGSHYAAKLLFPKWETEFQAVISGEEWVDFTLADKGSGLRQLCERLGIGLDEVMSFGDNYNDLPLLDIVGTPYIMDNAAPDLRQRFPLHCRRVEDVLKTL